MTTLLDARKTKLKILIPILLLLAACSSKPSLEIELPTRALNDFIPTESYPSNSFLFVTANYRETCSESCHCVMLEEIRDPYRFDDDTLFLVKWFLEDDSANWTEYRKTNKLIGLYSYWKSDDATFANIKLLPYNLKNTSFKIQATDASGDALISIDINEFILEAGKTATYKWTESKANSCQILYAYNISNFGFIDDRQVIIEE